MSSKDIEKMFVGQPIFKQLIDFIPKNKFDLLAQKHQMLAMQGKLNHLGLEKSPAKSTVGDGLRERDNEFFKDFYFLLFST